MAASTSNWRPLRAYALAKRAMDPVAAAVGLLVLSPLFAITAIAIKLDSKGPVFFRQNRVGHRGELFRIFKFRTMCVDAEQMGAKLTITDDPRVTRVGAFLRRSKIDELPQLINVLRGEMSLVGPRPESPEYVRFYTPEQRKRILGLRPGVTDFASILLRDEASLFPPGQDPVEIYSREIIPLKLACYDRYFDEMGVITDIRIILSTLLLLALGRSPRWLAVETDLTWAAPGPAALAERAAGARRWLHADGAAHWTGAAPSGERERGPRGPSAGAGQRMHAEDGR